ncbi:MAG: flavodoxin family protein, partial [Syntrophales bacterium]|nr:flavodoxin family protein [Syntrophales bacterium]
MKVLALNSSTRSDDQSKTAMMLASLVNGMREAGADVEKINLRDKKINFCVCCYRCMTTSPGSCFHKDDMSMELFPKWLESDLCVYGTPLFYHTVNAPMKAFLERTFPVCEPYLYEKEGRWHHPLRNPPPAAVFLSVCGFPAMSAFEALSGYLKFLYGGSSHLWAEIYRDGAEGMVSNPRKYKEILEATQQAGRELVKNHGVSQETMSVITQPLGSDIAMMAEVANSAWQTCIDEGITLPQFQKRQMIPRPLTVRAFAGIMRMGFNEARAADMDAVIQFVFSG